MAFVDLWYSTILDAYIRGALCATQFKDETRLGIS